MGMFHVKHSENDAAKARLSLVALGALSALAQFLLMREILFLAGGTELSVAIVLALWLVAGGLGALLGGHLGTKAVLPLLFAVCAVLLPAEISLLRALRGLLAGKAGEVPAVFTLLALSSLIGAALPALLGAIFPIAARELRPRGAAKAYIIETAALAAGGALTLALVAVGQEYIAVALVSVLFILSAAATAQRKRVIVAAFVLVPLLLLFCGAWAALERATTAFAFRVEKVVSFASTSHGRAFSAIVSSHPHIYSNGLAETPLPSANEAVELALALTQNPGRVLVICEDPQGYILTLSTFKSSKSTVLVSDTGILAFRDAVRPLPTAQNVALVACEPIQYLRSAGPKFDAIIMSVGAPLSMQNNRLYTTRFFRLVKSRLEKNGLFALELPYAPGHISSDLAALTGSLWQTLAGPLPRRRLALTQHAGTIILLASKRKSFTEQAPVPLQNREAARKALGLHEPIDFNTAYFGARTKLTAAMLTSRKWPVNTVTNPASYQLGISYSQRRFGPPGVLAWIWKLRFYHWLVASGAIAALFMTLALLGKGEARACSGAFAGGLCSMIAQIQIIYIFQSAHGLLYSLIGLLVGAFMLGAVAGSLTTSRLKPSTTRAFLLLTALALYNTALPFLLGPASSGGIAARYLAFPALSLAAGFLAGAIFPACSNLLSTSSAGRLYASDLAGASIGALLTGLVFVPSLGTELTAFLAGIAGVLLAFPLLSAKIRWILKLRGHR